MNTYPRHRGTGHRRVRGFTLIELLVVVAILAIMLSMLLPAILSAQSQVRMSQCQMNLHRLSEALLAVGTEQGTSVPPPFGWMDVIAKRVDARTFVCPDDQRNEDVDKAFGNLDQVFIRVNRGNSGYHDVYLFGEHPDIDRPDADGVPPPHQIVERRNISDDGASFDLYVEDLQGGGDLDWDVRLHIYQGDEGTWCEVLRGSNAGYTHDLYNGPTLLLQNIKAHETTGWNQQIAYGIIPAASYGFDSQVPLFPRPEQLMLLDYDISIADVDGAGSNDDDFYDLLGVRHKGKVNIATADGGVRTVVPIEVDPSREIWVANP